ncbi:MAG: sugar ABC transporter ATP-binding protein [Solirubrobacteraceae bacterium]
MSVDAPIQGLLRLRAEGLSKTFGSTRVLERAEIAVAAGEVHALVGANGSGKSTLVKCITGVERPDRGALLELDGQPVPGDYSTSVAHALGVRVVHQEAPLIDTLTLAETIGLHRGFPTRAGVISPRALAARSEEIFGRLHVDVSPRARAGSLSPPERAMVMLALALGDGEGRLIVLDEPTASLTSGDARRFLAAVRRAAEHRAGVLLVTHRLAEVFDICDAVTVLAGGRVALRSTTPQTTRQQLIDEIVGSDQRRAAVSAARAPERFLPRRPRAQAGAGGAELLAREVAADAVQDISLSVARGEILGISGLLGSGASELCGLLAGALPLRHGTVSVGGVELPAGFGTREAIAAGICLVPGDRLREGGIRHLSLLGNMTLPNLRRYRLGRRRALGDFREVVSCLDVRPPEPQRAFGTLSGGNQQKAIVGKWALMRPRVFLLDNPTAGVDPGARQEILALLRGLAEAGTAVVLHSSEPEELARVATRVLIVREGRLVAELDGEHVTDREITAAN